MRINDPDAYRIATDIDVIAALLDLAGSRVLELGCGAGGSTRQLVDRLRPAEVIATEVDRAQLDKNAAIDDLPQVSFRYGGAEAIDAPDASFDAVFMFKSLHHVPVDRMDRALVEIHRVLRPHGAACFVEPVYWGDFNALMSLIHDEQHVRAAAFAALERAVSDGRFRSEAEVFVQVPGTYPSWDAFASRFLDITHTELNIDDERRQRIREAFERHLTASGGHFLKPHRIDILRKTGADNDA